MPRILLIDDDPLMRDLVGRMLAESGHTVFVAADGEAGVAAIEKEPVDLVITDLLMPNKEGMETIMEIRAFHPQVRIIAISGGQNPALVASNLWAAGRIGAEAVLEKPFTPAQLAQAIDLAMKLDSGPAGS